MQTTIRRTSLVRASLSALCLLGVAAIPAVLPTSASAEELKPNRPANYDEALVPKFELPDPLTAFDGTKIETAEDWTQKRRPELLASFRSEMFGQAPIADLSKVKFEELNSADDALGGKATRKEIRIYFDAPNPTPKADLLLYIPNDRKGPVPAFLMPNFQGNHTTTDDPAVTAFEIVGRTWSKEKPIKERGVAKRRWAFEKIVDAGLAIATVNYEEIDPDFDDGFKNGVHALFKNDREAGDFPATIAGWAWGLSRALDCIEQTVPEIDATKVTIAGHSRLGKTALWCGANDERFAAVISNDSGCGGAALSRREFGERVDQINFSFPHWFCANFKKYGPNVNSLPFDEHELIALIAPRPVYVASASEDKWADQKGEFLSAFYADPVYRLLGTDGFGDVKTPEPPAIDQPVGATIRYHERTGVHDVTDYDWEQYIKFVKETVCDK